MSSQQSCQTLFAIMVICLVLVIASAEDTTAVQDDLCDMDESELTVDGTIPLEMYFGSRIKANSSSVDTVGTNEYRFYHLCFQRHPHEHQISVNLTCIDGNANLYISSEQRFPRIGHATWISQQPRSDHATLYTYLDGFPRKTEDYAQYIPLHIGVLGADDVPVKYNLTVTVFDLQETRQIEELEQFYTLRHEHDRLRQPHLVAGGRWH